MAEKDNQIQTPPTPQGASGGTPIVQKPERLSFGDSVAVASILVGVYLVIIVPPLWAKVPLLFVICVGTFWFARRSNWTHGWPVGIQNIVASIIVIVCLVVGVPQFISQWKQEHSFPFSIKAFVSVRNQNGKTAYGIKWEGPMQDVRLTIDDTTKYPVHNLDLTVRVLEKEELLFGMGQVSDIPGVEFHAPDLGKMSLDLQGTNGQWSRLEFADIWHLNAGDHWKMFCPTVPAEVPLRLAIAAVNKDPKLGPKKLRIYGSYEVISDEGNRFATFDKVVPVD